MLLVCEQVLLTATGPKELAWRTQRLGAVQAATQPAPSPAGSRSQVDQLLRLLASLFPLRPGKKGVLCVYPYHKLVVDWLSDQQQQAGFAVDVSSGHAALGAACYAAITAAQAAPAVASASEEVAAYALRHGVAHLCEARRTAQLEQLVLEVVGLWQRAYAAGGCCAACCATRAVHASSCCSHWLWPAS